MLIGVTAYTFTEIESESVFLSVVLPIIVFLSLVSSMTWLAVLFHKMGVDKNQGIQKVENNAPISPGDIGGIGGNGDGGC